MRTPDEEFQKVLRSQFPETMIDWFWDALSKANLELVRYVDPSIAIEHVERDLKMHGGSAENVVMLIDIIKTQHAGARNIVVQEWHRVVKEYDVVSGTLLEKLVARILDRLVPMTADEIRTRIAKKVWEYQEGDQQFGAFDSVSSTRPMGELVKKMCIDLAELIREELYDGHG